MPRKEVPAVRKRAREAKDEYLHPPQVVKALKEGVNALSVSAAGTGGTLLGRESQLADVSTFLEEGTSNPTLQLFGMPGTGKTAVVKQALNSLTFPHTSLFLNGYVMMRPSEVYVSLWKHLSATRLDSSVADVSAEHAQQQLEKRFCSKTGWSRRGKKVADLCVIVVDEMDKCCDKNGKTLFKLVDWVGQPGSRCKLITMANLMQLPERVDQKTKSRLNTIERVTFPPYSGAQLKAIIEQRVGHIKPQLFKTTALSSVCNQLGNSHGDVRRLLQITAAAVHEVLCAENAIQTKDCKEGILQFSHVFIVLKHVLHDTFNYFVSSVTSPLQLVVMCMLTKHTIVRSNEGQNAVLPLSTFYAMTESLFDQAVGKFLPTASNKQSLGKFELTFAEFVAAINTLREVHFLDLLDGSDVAQESAQRLRDTQGMSVFWTHDDLHVVLAQVQDNVRVALESHPTFGKVCAELIR